MSRSLGFQSMLGGRRVIGILAVTVATTASMLIAGGAASAATPSAGSHLPLASRASTGAVGAPAALSRASRLHQALTRGQVGEINGSTGGGFGSGVAIQKSTTVGGTSTMVVGAPYDNSSVGAAYVYTGSGGSWTKVATLTPSDGAANDYFGYAVAIGQGVIVVGSPCHSLSANYCTGAAYVFTGSGGSWTQTAEMNDPGQAANDDFAVSLALGSGSILVGALGENSYAGAVFVYTLQGAQKAELSDPANTANDLFGTSLAASGVQLVAGAPGTAGHKGAVYYYSQVRGGWIEKATLTASNSAGCSSTCGNPNPGLIYGDYFGDSVALGRGAIAVGAPYALYPTPAPDSVGSGATYVFTGSGSTWAQKVELSDPTEDAANAASPPGCNGFSNPCNALDEFGYQVAFVGTELVPSAPYDAQGYPNNATGAVFAYPNSGGTWSSSHSTKIVSNDGVAGDEFGSSGLVAAGGTTFAVATPYSSGGAYNGSVYFFRL